MADLPRVDPVRLVTWLSPGIRAELFEAVAERLAGALGREVQLAFETARSGPAPDDDPLLDGRADLGWMCATAYVERERVPFGADLVGVAWVPADVDGAERPVYFSDVVLAADRAPVGDVADLAGLRIGCNDRASLSGWGALHLAMRSRGLDVELACTVVFTGGHHRSLAALDAGDVDAIVIDSVTRLTERPVRPASLRLGPWPTQPLVASPDLGLETRRTVANALVRWDATPGTTDLFRRCGIVGFATVGADAYRGVAAAHAAARSPRPAFSGSG